MPTTPPATRAYFSMTYELPTGARHKFGAVAYTDQAAIDALKAVHAGAQVVELRRIGSVQAIASDTP